MTEIDVKFVDTPAYGTIKFTDTEKGWCWQYDEVLVMSCNEAMEEADFPPYYIPEDYLESDEYIPYLEDLDDDCFFETYEKAYENMLEEMGQMRIMGTIEVYV